MTPLGEIPIHLAPLDVVIVSGPLAALMLAAELASYWRYGRVPAASGRRLTLAMVLAAVLLPAAAVAIFRWHPAALLIIGAVLIVWVSHSYRRTTTPVSRQTKALCILIRILIIVPLLLYLLRPTYRQVKVIYEKAALFVLYDSSKSMTIADAGENGKAMRYGEAHRAGQMVEGRLAALSGLFDVKQYLFDDGLSQPINSSADLTGTPAGESTAIGKAIRQACVSVPGKKIAGLIICTDGSNNVTGPATDPLQLAGSLARQGSPVPIWPVGVGQEKLATDRPVILARQIALPDKRVQAFNVLPVHAVFDLMNLGGVPVKVELLFGQGDQAKVVDTRTVTADPGKSSDTVQVDMEVTPTATGFQAVTVRVAAGQRHKDQLLATDQSRITEYVQVVDDLVQVLYVEGKYRYEAKYLIAALAGSNLMRLSRHTVLTSAALEPGGSQQLPTTEAEWRRYHVIIIGDVKANAFTAEQLRIIRDLVRDLGKGVLMIGGRDTFAQGGWPDSPLAEVMPLSLRDAAGQLPDKFKLTATPRGLAHQLMRLDEDPARNAALWNRMPPIEGANRFPPADAILAAHPGAVILATTPGGQPVMVAQEAGKGRAMAMGIDTTWRWRLHLDNGRELHNRFWRQVVLWLANRQGNTWVTTDQPRYRLSQVRQTSLGSADRLKIVVKAGMEDQTGKAVMDPAATLVEALPPDSQGKSEPSPVPLGAGAYKQDHYELDLPAPARDGTYKLVFRGTLEGKPVNAETSFLVESTDIELSRPLANFDLLRQMAAAGESAGAKFYTVDKLDELLNRFKSSDYLVKREETQSTELGNALRWPILLWAFAGLLIEWVLRKWKGLV